MLLFGAAWAVAGGAAVAASYALDAGTGTYAIAAAAMALGVADLLRGLGIAAL